VGGDFNIPPLGIWAPPKNIVVFTKQLQTEPQDAARGELPDKLSQGRLATARRVGQTKKGNKIK
jgi:hypothetical protein